MPLATSNITRPKTSVTDYNNQFMKNNPQYGYNGNTDPTSLGSGLLSKVKPVSSVASVPNTSSLGALNKNIPGVGNTGYAPNNGLAVSDPVQNVSTSPSMTNTSASAGVPGYWQNALSAQRAIATGQGNPAVNKAVTSLQGQTTINPALTDISGLQGIAANQTPDVIKAKEDYARFSKASPYMLSDVRGNPNVAADVSVGRGAVLGANLAAEQQALASNVANALTGQGQQITAGQAAGNLGLTGQAQQITAANEAGGLGLTGQGQQISALGNITNATAPTQIPYGVQYGTPEQLMAGNAAGGGGALNPINNVQSLAQQVINGQISPSQAYAMGGSVQNWQGLLNSEIQKQKPGFNTAQAEGNYSARQSNTQTQGTAPIQAGASGFGQATQDTNNLKLQVNNVESLGNLLVSTGAGQNINPLQFAPANQLVNDFKTSLSTEGQIRFNSSLAAFAGVASQLLANSSGQIPTDVSNNIAKIANGTITMGALRGLVDQARLEGHTKLGNQVSQLIDYQSQLNGGQPKNLPGTMSANGQNYVLSQDGTYNPI